MKLQDFSKPAFVQLFQLTGRIGHANGKEASPLTLSAFEKRIQELGPALGKFSCHRFHFWIAEVACCALKNALGPFHNLFTGMVCLPDIAVAEFLGRNAIPESSSMPEFPSGMTPQTFAQTYLAVSPALKIAFPSGDVNATFTCLVAEILPVVSSILHTCEHRIISDASSFSDVLTAACKEKSSAQALQKISSGKIVAINNHFDSMRNLFDHIVAPKKVFVETKLNDTDKAGVDRTLAYLTEGAKKLQNHILSVINEDLITEVNKSANDIISLATSMAGKEFPNLLAEMLTNAKAAVFADAKAPATKSNLNTL